jgi:hypothetical protein
MAGGAGKPRRSLICLANGSTRCTSGVSRVVVLDMDSSESPTYGAQEGNAYNGHFG